MGRVIDVVFVHPKNRHLVIWHKGEWWQINKMSLSATTWGYKTAYKGTLDEIFVAKDQALTCQELTQTLKTHELPAELRGISATKFLSWWSINDYNWLKRDIITLDSQAGKAQATITQATHANSIDTQANLVPANDKATNSSADLKVTDNKATTAQAPSIAPSRTATPTQSNTSPTVTPVPSSTVATPIPSQPPITPTSPTQPPEPPKTQAPVTQSPTTQAPKDTTKDENKDIFESLLDDLHDEILHHK